MMTSLRAFMVILCALVCVQGGLAMAADGVLDVSPYNANVELAQAVANVQQSSRGFQILAGTIDLDTDEVTFRAMLQSDIKVAPALPDSGRYGLRLLNQRGDLVKELAFDVAVPVEEGPISPGSGAKLGSFLFAIPLDWDIRRAVILKDGRELASLSASPGSPTVRLISPNGGETLTGEDVTVTWAASDPDGDPLSFVVEYSADGGDSWDVLTIDYEGRSLNMAQEFLKATDRGLFRVQANDGFHSASDVSDGVFTIPNHLALLIIRSPGHQASFVGAQMLIFRADAYDSDEGFLPKEKIEWTSSLDGFLEAGSGFHRLASDLTEGVHVIEARVTDSHGAMVTRRIAVRISRVPVPIGRIVLIDAVREGEDRTGLTGKSVINVAILGSSREDGDAVDFDAARVDPGSLVLQGLSTRIKVSSIGPGNIDDVNGDERPDFVTAFEFGPREIAVNDKSVILQARTLDGTAVVGTGRIRTPGETGSKTRPRTSPCALPGTTAITAGPGC